MIAEAQGKRKNCDWCWDHPRESEVWYLCERHLEMFKKFEYPKWVTERRKEEAHGTNL